MDLNTDVFATYEKEAMKYPFLEIDKKTGDHILIQTKNKKDVCSSKIYAIFHHALLSIVEYNTESFFGKNISSFEGVRINYCLEGRMEVCMQDDMAMFMKPNDLFITSKQSKGEYVFPSGYYRGIQLFFPASILDNSPEGLLYEAGINAKDIFESLFDEQGHYISVAENGMKTLLHSLVEPPENLAINWYQLKAAEFLLLLANGKNKAANRQYTLYTRSQVEIAKQVMQIISGDLSRRISIAKLAEPFGISETSLKNYFKGVYGQSITAYLKNARLNLAKEALGETEQSVSDISAVVGYENVSKFSAFFRAATGEKPLEYR